MTRPKLVNLLDDFALGGVSRGLGIFDAPAVRAVVEPSVVAVNGNALIAPRLQADVIVTHFPPSWRRLLFLASLKIRNPHAKIIHIEHSYTRAWAANNVANRARFRAMLSLACKLVDKVVCVSKAQADWLAETSGMNRHAVQVIYPYSDNPGLAELAVPNFARNGPLRVGAYGRFHEAKGFDRLIEAFKAGAMPGTELIIGGFGPEGERLMALAKGTPGIRFAGKISDVSAFLAGCDVVAIPSRWEAFGQVATESREAGRPIFVAPTDGLVEQVGQAGKIIDFTSNQRIEEAFTGLDCAELAEMSKSARLSTRDAGASRIHGWARLLSDLLAQSR